MEKLATIIGTAVVLFFVVLGVSLLMTYPTLWAVNYLFTPAVIASLFGTAHLTFWKAFVLNFLCGTLFKSTTKTSSSGKK